MGAVTFMSDQEHERQLYSLLQLCCVLLHAVPGDCGTDKMSTMDDTTAELHMKIVS